MKKSTIILGALAAVIGVWIVGEVFNVPGLTNLALMSALVAVLIIVYYYMRFEEKKSDAKLIAILGSLAALSVAGRCLFAAIPNVKPSSFIIIVTGYVFGPLSGFMVGATTALVSNIFFGQGPWTIWQMLAWGLAGLVAGLLGPRSLLEGHWRLAFYCAAWGFLFGWIMNVYFVLGFVHPVTAGSFLAVYASSAWFDGLHAAGNFIFAFAFGPALVGMLRRYQARFFFEPVKLAAPPEPGRVEV